MNPYLGHELQMSGVEEYRMCGGKGDGMRLFRVRNGKGLELDLLPDRCGDIGRLTFCGINAGWLSPCGFVAPAYYDCVKDGWLKSFTAGFLTTCGLQAVGQPCTDGGEELPLHGSIANLPAEQAWWECGERDLIVKTLVKDEVIFGRKLCLSREICVSTEENRFWIRDEIENTGDRREPLEILYHMNLGYPLLDETSVLQIPSKRVIPRDDWAANQPDGWKRLEKPQPGYRERCYYHDFGGERGQASLFHPGLKIGLEISFDSRELDGFVEWKMMGVRDYVLGLECGNCYPDGRDVMREKGILKWIDPGQKISHEIRVSLRNL